LLAAEAGARDKTISPKTYRRIIIQINFCGFGLGQCMFRDKTP
jgi:hypothetical protein